MIEYFHIGDPINLRFRVNITVGGRDGLVYTYLPQSVVDLLEQFKLPIKYGRGSRPGYMSANSWNELKTKLNNLVDSFTEMELIETKIVLRYNLYTYCHYALSNTGSIHTNGVDLSGDYRWEDGNSEHAHDAMYHGPYGLSIYVKPALKKTYKFVHIDKVTSTYQSVPEHQQDDHLKWLDSLIRIGSGNQEELEVDYTPAVGQFFINAIMSIFRLNEQLKAVISTPQALMSAIKVGSFCNGLVSSGSDDNGD